MFYTGLVRREWWKLDRPGVKKNPLWIRQGYKLVSNTKNNFKSTNRFNYVIGSIKVSKIRGRDDF